VTSLLLVLFFVAVGTQLAFIFFVFSRTAFYTDSVPMPKPTLADAALASPGLDAPATIAEGSDAPGVSILVCAWNEKENLRELLPLLDSHDYPNFEVVVLDDRSWDGTKAYLEEAEQTLGHLRSIRIDREHEHVTPKKYALTIGIRQATHEIVLLTDADCRPASDQWLAGMAAHLEDPAKQIVLGVSPYTRQPGWLNRLIRYETLMTAVQYLSLALAGRPYMGVGRNLMYRRSLFLANKGFYSHIRVLGGDDDLFINEVGTADNVAVCIHPETFTYSAPKTTFAAWRHQKGRHLSVSQYYKPGNKLRLGLFSGSLILNWVLGLPLLLVAVERLVLAGGDWQRVSPGLLAAAGLFLLRLLAYWIIVGRISQRLERMVHWIGMPVMDACLSMYYVVMGTVTLLPRRKKRMSWR